MWFLKLIVCITPCIFYLCMTCFTPAVLNSSPPPSAFEVVGSIFNYTHTRVSPLSAIVCSRDKACMRQMTSEKLQYIIIGYGLLWTTDTESSSSASRCTIETIHFDTPSVVTHGLRLWGRLDVLPNSLKRLWWRLMEEKWTFNSRATALVDIPAVSMPITHSLKSYDICGIVR